MSRILFIAICSLMALSAIGSSQIKLVSSLGEIPTSINDSNDKNKNQDWLTYEINSTKPYKETYQIENYINNSNIIFEWRSDEIDSLRSIDFCKNDKCIPCTRTDWERKNFEVNNTDNVAIRLNFESLRGGKFWIAFPSLRGSMVFKNYSVTPEKGSILYPFSFKAELADDEPRLDVELQTKYESSDRWISQGNGIYDRHNKTFEWNDLKFNYYNYKDNNIRYRFLNENIPPNESRRDLAIIPLLSNVTPDSGSLLNGSYTYNIILTKEDVFFLSKCNKFSPKDLTLEINNLYDDSKWLPITDGNWSNIGISFKVSNLGFINSDYLGKLKYRFVSHNQLLGEFNGPDIYFRIEPLNTTKPGIISARVKSTRCDLPINLKLHPDGCANVTNNPKIYNKCSSCEWDYEDWEIDKQKLPKNSTFEFLPGKL